jgi:hypothetical protein
MNVWVEQYVSMCVCVGTVARPPSASSHGSTPLQSQNATPRPSAFTRIAHTPVRTTDEDVLVDVVGDSNPVPVSASSDHRQSMGASKRNRTPSFALGTAAISAAILPQARRSIGGPMERVGATARTPGGSKLTLEPTPSGHHMQWTSEAAHTTDVPASAPARDGIAVCRFRCQFSFDVDKPEGDEDGGDDDNDELSDTDSALNVSMGSVDSCGSHKAPRKWTAEEDEALRQSVEANGSKNLKAIALGVPGRNHVQCLQRWKKV